MQTLYRRPLPEGTIAFSSPEGRQVFAEALRDGGLDGWFRLAEQFHTQADPAFCGLGSLVVALNALGIDPGRLWKGPWRWFAEDLLDCCVPLDVVRARGLTLDQLACLARCNGADVRIERAREDGLASLRDALARSARGEGVLIASYDRATLGQTGSGHFSPIGGFHPGRDLVLVLDVARFKYPPHWVPAERLWRAMFPADAETALPRGFLLLEARRDGIALGFSLGCDRDGWQGLARRLAALGDEIAGAADVDALARLVLPLTAHVEVRTPTARAHAEAFARARAALRESHAHRRIAAAIGEDAAEAATLLSFALADQLDARMREALGEVSDETLLAELRSVRAQLSALRDELGSELSSRPA